MHLLKTLLKGIRIKTIVGNAQVQIKSLSFDSRKVDASTVFVAIRGTQADGHHFIGQAIKAGSRIVVCERKPIATVAHVTYVIVENSASALGIMASNFYKTPSAKLKLVAVTGTNGKTSTVHLLYGLFQQLGYRVGMLSTIHNKIHQKILDTTLTTPDPIAINHVLAQMVKAKCQYCFMEASSHALAQNRTAGLCFSGAVFTNITHDHLDYHHTFEAYLQAKKKLFDALPAHAFALYNNDDPRGKVMVQNTQATPHSFALKMPADFTAKIQENTLGGLSLRLAGQLVWFQLIGRFNAYNLLAAYATACLLGKKIQEVLTALSTLPPIQGRFQQVLAQKNFSAIVDYAHTPDALYHVLMAIRQVNYQNRKIITVVGCGGNRDTKKRPLTAKIACKLSDQVILTTDNPRNEDPDAIIKAMEAGLNAFQQKQTLTIVNRRQAIKAACALAVNSPAIVLVAGKGHECYQEIQGKRLPFDDAALLQEIMQIQ